MEISTEREFLSGVEIGNEQFRLLVEASPFGILIASSDDKIVLVNRFAEDLFGFTCEELTRFKTAEVIEGGLAVSPGKLEFIGKYHAETFHTEGSVHHFDGRSIPVEMSLSPLPCGGRLYVLATITDVTEKRRNESQLAFLADVMERIYEAVVFLDEQGHICFWNPGAAIMFGVEEAEVMGAAIDQTIDLGLQRSFAGDLIPKLKKFGKFEEVITCFDAASVSKRVRMKGAPVTWGERHGTVWLANDITREARLEAEIVKVAENEQRRIGQDIHDDLCSQLAAIGCLVEVLQQEMPPSDAGEPVSLEKVAELISVAGETARTLAAGLANVAVKGVGFVGAVRALAETREAGSSMECRLTLQNEDLFDQLGEEQAIHLYRILQEAMNNAVKHSHASRIEIELSSRDGMALLVVSDNGDGFGPGPRESGMGLLTIKRRAEMIGGELEVSSALGEGTRIKCVVPLHDRS